MEPQLVDFMGILVVGTLLSLLVQYLKKKFGTDTMGTKLMTIGLSIAIGAGYYFLRDTALLQTLIGVLTAASAVYALILKK